MARKRNVGHNQYLKSKVRQTKEWRQLRIDIEDAYDGLDPITGKKLLKGFNVHHLDMRTEHYDDLNIEKFRPLNKSTHDAIHWLYRYYEKDPTILDRIREMLDLMLQYK